MQLPTPANDNAPTQLDPLLKLANVIAATGLSSSTIYRMMDDGQFPRPLHVQPMSLKRSIIEQQHRPILGQPPAR
jgi:predicted DNA-binding transcriptional regulator AlpA